ncbi:hypothetical protein DEO72_LG11g1172 [Vigna unguiculata]|uniref:Uncharacterized protein n=1 Tax=Vigna unguiculata TaxID=3917 RepID=A0A4D6NNE3_VIGUN|nr:hypothetical protein DEO72_LG11g1172 [Vigna unguiculata]
MIGVRTDIIVSVISVKTVRREAWSFLISSIPRIFATKDVEKKALSIARNGETLQCRNSCTGFTPVIVKAWYLSSFSG